MPADKKPRTPFGAAVREKRRARGLSQQELACACGFSQAKLSQLETGDRIPRCSMLSSSPPRWRWTRPG